MYNWAKNMTASHSIFNNREYQSKLAVQIVALCIAKIMLKTINKYILKQHRTTIYVVRNVV